VNAKAIFLSIFFDQTQHADEEPSATEDLALQAQPAKKKRTDWPSKPECFHQIVQTVSQMFYIHDHVHR
jgi:hypothetical protein